MKLRPGFEILAETLGDGSTLELYKHYQFRLQIRLSRGEPVRWNEPWGMLDRAHLEDAGTTLVTDLRIDRESMFPGLFYGVQGMRLGGRRRLNVAPHLGFGSNGVPGTIPPNALLTVEIAALAERQL